jgi:hypothetical protein
MKKSILFLSMLFIATAPFQSFTINETNPKELIWGQFKNKTVTASDNTVVRVHFVINESTSAILQVRVFEDSDCSEYSIVGYTGNIYQSGSDYYANNINIDLNGTDYAIVNGLLNNGMTGCEGS